MFFLSHEVLILFHPKFWWLCFQFLAIIINFSSLFLPKCCRNFPEFLLVSPIILHILVTVKIHWFHSFVQEATKFYLFLFSCSLSSPSRSWISGRDPLVVWVSL